MVPEEYGEDAEEEEVRAAVVVPPLRVAAAAAAGRRVGLPQHGAVVGLLAEKVWLEVERFGDIQM